MCTHNLSYLYLQSCTELPEQPILAARTAARTGQFWQPELYPELPSSGSQNSSQSCCSGQNCAAKIGSTVQAELGSSGRKTSQNWPENCPELVSFGCKNPASTGQNMHSRYSDSSARTEMFWQQKGSSQIPGCASVTKNPDTNLSYLLCQRKCSPNYT